MSKFKKIFVIIAGIISAFSATFIISICSIKSNVGIAIGDTYSAVVFDCSTSGKEIKGDDTLKQLEKEVNHLTNISVYSKLINNATLDKKIYLDTDGKFAKYSTDLLNGNLVIEYIYTTSQDLIVYSGKDTRVISYVCISFVIPKSKGYTEIAVYYSSTSNTDGNEKNESYASNTPLVLYGNAKSISKFASKISSGN